MPEYRSAIPNTKPVYYAGATTGTDEVIFEDVNVINWTITVSATTNVTVTAKDGSTVVLTVSSTEPLSIISNKKSL